MERNIVKIRLIPNLFLWHHRCALPHMVSLLSAYKRGITIHWLRPYLNVCVCLAPCRLPFHGSSIVFLRPGSDSYKLLIMHFPTGKAFMKAIPGDDSLPWLKWQITWISQTELLTTFYQIVQSDSNDRSHKFYTKVEHILCEC